MSPHWRSQTFHDETGEAVADGINAAKSVGRQYLAEVECSSPDCHIPASFDLAGIEGTAVVRNPY